MCASAGVNRREIYRRARRLAEYHVAAASHAAGGRVALVCSDNQIDQTIAIDIAGTGDTSAAIVSRTLAVDDKAAGAGRDRRQVNRCARRLAEHNIAAASQVDGSRVALACPDNQIGQTIAINITGTSDTITALVIPALTVNDKAAGSVSDRR